MYIGGLLARFVTLASTLVTSVVIVRQRGQGELLFFVSFSTALNLLSAIALRDWDLRVLSRWGGRRSATIECVRTTMLGVLMYVPVHYLVFDQKSLAACAVAVALYSGSTAMNAIYKTRTAYLPAYELLRSGGLGAVGVIVVVLFGSRFETEVLFAIAAAALLLLSFPALLSGAQTSAADAGTDQKKSSVWMLSMVGVLLLTVEALVASMVVPQEHAAIYGAYNRALFLYAAAYGVLNNYVVASRLRSATAAKPVVNLAKLAILLGMSMPITFAAMAVLYGADLEWRASLLILIVAGVAQVYFTIRGAGDLFVLSRSRHLQNFLRGSAALGVMYAIGVFLIVLTVAPELRGPAFAGLSAFAIIVCRLGAAALS